MFYIKKFQYIVFLALLTFLSASCGSNTDGSLGGKKVNNKRDETVPTITPKTILYYASTTKEDLDGTSGRDPITPDCIKRLKVDHEKPVLYNGCSFAGDVVMLGKIVASGYNVGCTDGKIDSLGSRYEFVIKVLHVFAGQYSEKEIRVDVGPPRFQAKLATLGDTILFSAFNSDDHWFLAQYLVNRPDDKTPFARAGASTRFLFTADFKPGCALVDLPNKVEDLDNLFKKLTTDEGKEQVCESEPLEERAIKTKDTFIYNIDNSERHPIGKVGDKCPFDPNF